MNDLTQLHTKDLDTQKKVFNGTILEYFKPFWEAHSLPVDWLNQDTSHYMTEQKPVFHGIVIGWEQEDLKIFERGIKKSFANAGMPLDLSGYYCDNIYNRAGEFTFVNLSTNNKSIDGILRGRTYDVAIVIKPDFIDDISDILKVISETVNKDRSSSRIFVIGQRLINDHMRALAKYTPPSYEDDLINVYT